MKRIIYFAVIFFLVGCGPKMDSDGELAKQYLLDQGYDIESYEGNKDYSLPEQN
jgi:hypothetical protein